MSNVIARKTFSVHDQSSMDMFKKFVLNNNGTIIGRETTKRIDPITGLDDTAITFHVRLPRVIDEMEMIIGLEEIE